MRAFVVQEASQAFAKCADCQVLLSSGYSCWMLSIIAFR